MGLIIQPAKLVLCKSCEVHGFIVFSDGSKSKEFHTCGDALAEVVNALLAKKIIEVEAEFLRDEIHRSKLPTEAEMEIVKHALEEIGALDKFAGQETEQSVQADIPPNRTLH